MAKMIVQLVSSLSFWIPSATKGQIIDWRRLMKNIPMFNPMFTSIPYYWDTSFGMVSIITFW